ncbi:MAG: SMI1/KNR4 family protein [Ruminococcus flavefaciens]|nr:SMI1/KNR4 family protein [Ruminococcus flavefaciens]
MNKSIEEYRTEIKKILEEYYELLRIYDKFQIQVLDYVEIPEGMFTGEVEIDTEYNLKLKTWKMIPSDVTEEDISELEKETGIRLPNPLKAYYTSYYHLWDWQINLSGNSPKAKMNGIYEAYNTLMIHFGYLPFIWDNQYGCLFCMKVDENNQDCGIYWIDHEELFAFKPKTVTAQDIEKAMDF